MGCVPDIGHWRSEPEMVNLLAVNDLKSFKFYFSLLEIDEHSTVR